MSNIAQLQQFFNDVSKNTVDPDKFWNNYVYIALNEWHWNHDELCSAPIPFVLQTLKFRGEVKKKEEREMKKKR
jgi:hypothetical protein